MAKRGVRTAGGGKTRVLWEVKQTTADASGSSTRFYALRSDGKLLSRVSSSFVMFGRRHTDSGHWSIARVLTSQEEQANTKAYLFEKGYEEVKPQN